MALMCPPELFCSNSPFESSFLSNIGEFSLIQAHNLMQNSIGAIFNDPTFSAANPLFMLYHGFVDYMMELYLRELRRRGNDLETRALNSISNFLGHPLYQRRYFF